MENLGVKADGPKFIQKPRWGSKTYHRWIQKQKHRLERRRAKKDPECLPGYGKYSGYES